MDDFEHVIRGLDMIGEFGHVCMNSDMLYEFDAEMWFKWYIVAHI
jgi:hypothetical protein